MDCRVSSYPRRSRPPSFRNCSARKGGGGKTGLINNAQGKSTRERKDKLGRRATKNRTETVSWFDPDEKKLVRKGVWDHPYILWAADPAQMRKGPRALKNKGKRGIGSHRPQIGLQSVARRGQEVGGTGVPT